MGDTSAPQLSRKATWIKKDVTLKSILKESRALKAFQDFSITVHAEEVSRSLPASDPG